MKRVLWMAGGLAAMAMLAVAAFGMTGARVARAAESVASPAPRAGSQDEPGVLVARVESGGPADTAGVKRGDIVLKVGDTAVNSAADITAALRDRKPGDEVKLSIQRGDAEKVLTVKLGDRNGQPVIGISAAVSGPGDWNGRRVRPALPMTPTKPTTETIFLMQPGALIVDVVKDSPAAKAGLAKGDVIVSLNEKALDAENSLADLVGALKPGDKVALEVADQKGASRDVTVTLGENPDKKGAAYLGVQYQQMPAMAGPGRDGMPSNPGRRNPMPMPRAMSAEVIIREVVKDSPAAKAGLRADDVIVAVDGKPVDHPQAVVDLIGARKPGDALTVTVKREDTLDVKVTLGENPNKKGAAYLGVSLAVRVMAAPGDDGSDSGSQGMLPDLPWLEGLLDMLPDLPELPGAPAGDSL